MEKSQKITLTLLRLVLGVLFLYAGYSHLIDPTFSAKGYIIGAKTFTGFYKMLTGPAVLPAVNFINEWGLTLLGLSLLLGLGVRLSAPLGALMMFLYYLPILNFPFIPPHSFLVDEHIVYAAALLLLYAFHAGRFYGVAAVCERSKFCRRYPKLHKLLD